MPKVTLSRNGHGSNKELLQTITRNYEPAALLASYGYFRWRKRPPFHRFIHVPAMIADPRIMMVMLAIKGALTSLCHFYVDETPGSMEDPPPSEIKKYVIKQITRWWRTSVGQMLQALEWGWFAAEPLYRVQNNGRIGFRGFRKLEPQDVLPVTSEGELVGIELRPWGQGAAREGGADSVYLGGEKAFWHVHWRERLRWWGWSRLFGAFEPWLDLHAEGGGMDIRRKWYYTHTFQGKRMYHPPGTYTDDVTGARKPFKEIARGMLEDERSGGVFAFPSQFDSITGIPLWKIEDPPSSGNAGGDVREYIYDLKREMTEGLGFPEEIIRAAETGSGYSGRAIPQEAFRGMLTDLAQHMVLDFDEQIVRPLVRREFHQEPDYEIIPFGLIEQEEEVTALTGNGQSVPDPVAKRAEAATAV